MPRHRQRMAGSAQTRSSSKCRLNFLPDLGGPGDLTGMRKTRSQLIAVNTSACEITQCNRSDVSDTHAQSQFASAQTGVTRQCGR